MKCPYCGNPMEQGKLRSKGGVFFLPDEEKSPKWYTQNQMNKHRAISFPPSMLDMIAEYPTAYVCRACKKLVLEFDNE